MQKSTPSGYIHRLSLFEFGSLVQNSTCDMGAYILQVLLKHNGVQAYLEGTQGFAEGSPDFLQRRYADQPP